MAQKPPPPTAWKTGEQLEFLLSREGAFKRAQEAETLERFWQKTFEDWYHQWEIPASPSLIVRYGSISEGRLALQREKNIKIKQWFNNRGRCSDTKGTRGDLKLDVNGKRKLAALQAYCSYAWSTLRPIVLARWAAQKTSATFEDEDDPPQAAEGSTDHPDGCIPLSFKLKVAKELYAQLPAEAKKEIDRRREEDRQKLYRRIIDIDDEGERNAKLQVHQKNQPLVLKSLNRILANLEDQAGCVAHLFIASVDPKGGSPSIQKFCQGSTKHGLGFETFYGDEWQGHVEDKFRQWAIRIFGEKGTEQRSLFLLPKDPTAPSEASSSGSQAEGASPQNPSTTPTTSQKLKSRSSRSRKSASQPSTSVESTAHQPLAPQVTVTSDSLQGAPSPALSPPVPHIPFDPSTSMPQVVRGSHTATPGGLNTVEPPQTVADSSWIVVEPSQVAPKLSQSPSEHPEVSAEVPMDIQPDRAALSPSQPLATVADSATNRPVPYRARNATTSASARSRRDSIDGAPEIMTFDATEEDMAVILSDYVNLDSNEDIDDDANATNDDDDRSHVSSSQKTTDGCPELSPPTSNSQQQHSSARTTEGNMSQLEVVSARTYPQLKVDENDLPIWMTQKGRWRYLTSTAGGTAWENLLKVYISQERRLEFADMGATFTSQGRPSKIKEYFQYAHQPSRGDSLKAPEFGAEVAGWWEMIQPEWRRSERDPPQDPNQWSYILSGGSKGAFLVIMCLAWWDRSHWRYVEQKKRERLAEAEIDGVAPAFDDLLAHDARWLNVVNDVAFVMQKAQDCDIPTRGVSSPSRGGKRKHQEDSQQVPAVKRSTRKV